MSEQNININLDIKPLVAAMITTAYYTARTYHSIEKTGQSREEIIREVTDHFSEVFGSLQWPVL